MTQRLQKLRDITRILREPGGCDWDRAQTHDSVKRHVIDEAYEVVDAIESANQEDLKEELGDLLFQVFFHARLAEEESKFTIDDVASAVCEKLIRRHPHVFSDTKVENINDIVTNWNKIKSTEKKKKGLLADVERSLPALLRAEKVQKKSSDTGFDWKDTQPVIDVIHSEIDELAEEIKTQNKENLEKELGDVLFSIVNLSRKLGINPEMALNRSTDSFIKRYSKMEELSQKYSHDFAELSSEEMERLWQEAKSLV